MAKEEEQPHEHNPVVALSEEAAEKADSLAPLEETLGATGRRALFKTNQATIEQDATGATGELRLPQDLLERKESWRHLLLHFEPIVVALVITVLLFICFVTFLIWSAADK